MLIYDPSKEKNKTLSLNKTSTLSVILETFFLSSLINGNMCLTGFMNFCMVFSHLSAEKSPMQEECEIPEINAGQISFNGNIIPWYGQNRSWTAGGWVNTNITEGK